VSEARDFAWIDVDELFDAYCVAAVVGAGVDEVVRSYGGDLPSTAHATFAEAFSAYPGPTYLLVDDVDRGVLAAENNGWQGVDDGVASRLSEGGRVTSLYSSVNADMRFVYAEDGVVTTAFDPLMPEVEWEGSDPRALDSSVGDLPFGEEAPGAASLALVERLTGIRVERSWFDEPHRRFDLPSPY
jgi:Family of unknown function (DUF6461)